MKIVAIISSPHGIKGSTGRLLEGVLEGARDAGADTEVFSLDTLEVKPCTACDACHITGKCPITDDYLTLKAAMEAADGVVFASPNYITSVSAQMKALLDRCCGIIHTQAFEDKYAAAVVTSGGGNSDVVEAYLQLAARSISFTTVGSVGALNRQMMNEGENAPFLVAAADLGRKLVTAIRNKQRFPEHDAERQAYRQRMHDLVNMHKDTWKYEYEFWATKP